MTERAERTRTYSWSDPADVRAARYGMTGLEYVRAMIAGQVPTTPTSATIGHRVVDAGEGWAVIEVEPAEFLANTGGGVQGGVIAAVIDSAFGNALMTTVTDETFTTLDLNCRYIRAIRPGTGPVTVRADVEHRGRTTATVRAEVHDGTGRLVASATSTLLIMYPEH